MQESTIKHSTILKLVSWAIISVVSFIVSVAGLAFYDETVGGAFSDHIEKYAIHPEVVIVCLAVYSLLFGLCGLNHKVLNFNHKVLNCFFPNYHDKVTKSDRLIGFVILSIFGILVTLLSSRRNEFLYFGSIDGIESSTIIYRTLDKLFEIKAEEPWVMFVTLIFIIIAFKGRSIAANYVRAFRELV